MEPLQSNFKVELNYNPQGYFHDGTGNLVIHDRHVAERLIRISHDSKSPDILVKDRKLRIYKAQKGPPRALTEMLSKTPYLDPDLEEARETTLTKLDIGLHISKVQFGIFYRLPEAPPTASRLFSNEYEISHQNKSAGILHIEYDHKIIRIQVRRHCNVHVRSASFYTARRSCYGRAGLQHRDTVCKHTQTRRWTRLWQSL